MSTIDEKKTKILGIASLIEEMSERKKRNLPIDDLEEKYRRAMGNGGGASSSRALSVPQNFDYSGGNGSNDHVQRGNSMPYKIAAPGQPKDYRSLFGSNSGKYQWTDKESNFFDAVFSKRFHPGLTQRAMNESVPTDGGFLVPSETAQRIHSVSLENEIVMPRAFVQPMKSNEINLLAMTIGDHSSNLFGGFTASYVAEAGTIPNNDPKTRNMTLTTNKLTGLLRISAELAADCIGGEQQIIDICGKGLSWYRDKYFLKGHGSGVPLGVLNSNCLLVQPKETGQAANTIEIQNLFGMLEKMYAGSFQNSIFVCHQSTLSQLLSLSIPVGTGGSAYPALKENGNGQFTLLTRPCIFTEKTEKLSSQGDILLADFSQYVVGLREGLNFGLSDAVYWNTHELSARLIERHCGQALWDEPLTLEDSTTQVSPFVTLEAR